MKEQVDASVVSAMDGGCPKIPSLASEHLLKVTNKVAASRVFHSASGLRRLLLYLATRTVDSPGNPPKELEIAIDVLDRPADFDPRSDSAVRVVTSRLRSKLAEYYQDEGWNDPLVLGLRRGCYILDVHPADARSIAPNAIFRGLNWQVWCAFACVLVVAAIAAYQVGRRATTEASTHSTPWTPAMQSFWAPYLASRNNTVILLGTPLMLYFNGVFIRDPQVNGWNEPDVAERLRKYEQSFRSAAHPSYLYTGVGEASGAFLIACLLHTHVAQIELRRSAAFAWDALRSSNVILLGAPKMNPQVADLPFEQGFVFQGGTIINRHPKPDEQLVYPHSSVQPDGGNAEGYSVITRLSGIAGYGEVLALSSGFSEGIWAAAEYVSQTGHIEELLRHVHTADGRWPICFQVMIHARFKAQVPVAIRYVTHRVLTPAANDRNR